MQTQYPRRVFTALDHVIVAVRDLPAATRTYATLLGRRPSWRGENPVAGTANALFRLGNTAVELSTPEGSGPTSHLLRTRLEAEGEGPFGLALTTADAAATHATLEARGLEPRAVEPGLDRDVESGAFRRWRHIALPATRTQGVLLSGIEHLSPPDLLPVAPVAALEPSCISGIDHAVVRTPDAEASIALYGDALGLRLALDRRFPQWNARLIFFRVGGVTLELAAALEEKPATAGDSDRFWGICWQVPDADAARTRLLAAGVDVSEVRSGRKPGTRVLTVRDGSCGVPTLLIEPAARAGSPGATRAAP